MWVSNAYGNTGVDYARFTCSSSRTRPAFNPNPDQQPTACVGSTRLAPNEINTIDPDFVVPQVWRANAAVDHRLPLDFTGTLEFLYTGTMKDIRYTDLSIAPVAGETVEGRPRLRAPLLLLAAPRDRQRVRPVEHRRGLQLQHHRAGCSAGSSRTSAWTPSYTYSQAKDVAYSGSSQASSNFRFRPTMNPNNPEV